MLFSNIAKGLHYAFVIAVVSFFSVVGKLLWTWIDCGWQRVGGAACRQMINMHCLAYDIKFKHLVYFSFVALYW